MTFSKTNKILMTCAAVALFASPAMANDLIDNATFGYVDGNITQFSQGHDNKLTIDVGSLTLTDSASPSGNTNNYADGYVGGDITQDLRGDNMKLTVEVGSIKALAADSNTAIGYVGGNITQMVNNSGAPTAVREPASVRVGSINAESGFAMNNTAEGFVNGDITQMVDANSKATVRVGTQIAK